MAYKKIEEYQIGFGLGKGTYFARKEDKSYCIKLIQISDERVKEKAKVEIQAMSKLNGHENIISLRDSFQFRDHQKLYYGFAIDLMEHDLRHYMELKKNHLKNSQLKEIARQLANAMNFIHENNIVHNDLKLENVMINPSPLSIKVIDFGLSEVCDTKEEMHWLDRIRGTPLYFPPEKASNSTPFSGVYSDVWSYGVLIYRLAVGVFPYNQSNMKQLLKSICVDPVSFPIKGSDSLNSFLSSILTKESCKRPDFKAILAHNYFSMKH